MAVLTCVCGALAAMGATAQDVTASRLPVYDVIAIRLNNQGPNSVTVNSRLDVFSTSNTSLADLIREAHDIDPDQVSGSPKWIELSLLDVKAKVTDSAADVLRALSRDNRRLMLRQLPADRFHLETNTELKMQQVDDMRVAKGGAKIGLISAEEKVGEFNGIKPGSVSIRDGTLTANGLTLDIFCELLSRQVHRAVMNKPGMAGSLHLQLSWTSAEEAASADATAPSLLTALEEQLGLKLVSSKGPVTTLIVDHAELPQAEDN